MDLHFSLEFWPLSENRPKRQQRQASQVETTAAPRMTRMVAGTVVVPFVCVLQVGPQLAFPDRFGAGYERKESSLRWSKAFGLEQLQG